MKLSTCALKKSKPSHAAAMVCSNAGGVAVLSANQSHNIGNTMSNLKLRQGNVLDAGESMAVKIGTEELISSSNSTTNDARVSGDSCQHKDTVSGGGCKFPDSVVQTNQLTACLRNDGTGDSPVRDGFVQSNDLALVDGNSCDIAECSSPPHEMVAACEIPEIPSASVITSDAHRPSLTQAPVEIVRQKTLSFLNAVKPHLFSPVLANNGLDPCNRVMFDGSTVHVGSAIDDIAVTFTWEPTDLDHGLDPVDKLEKDELLEQCLYEAMHR